MRKRLTRRLSLWLTDRAACELEELCHLIAGREPGLIDPTRIQSQVIREAIEMLYRTRVREKGLSGYPIRQPMRDGGEK